MPIPDGQSNQTDAGDLDDVRRNLQTLRDELEREPEDDAERGELLNLVRELESEPSVNAIAWLTNSAAARSARAAAELATGRAVRGPALVVPHDNPADPGAAYSVLKLGALVPTSLASALQGQTSCDPSGVPWSDERVLRVLAHEFVHLTQAEDIVPTSGDLYEDHPDTFLLEGLTECLACAGRQVSFDGNHYQPSCDVVTCLLGYSDIPLSLARELNAASVRSRTGLLARGLGVDEARVRAACDQSSWRVWPPIEGALPELLRELALRNGWRPPWQPATALRPS